MLMQAKQDATLTKEQVGIVEIPFRMFDVVMWDQGMLNGVIVGDCRWERFWYGTGKGRIKSGGRHNGKGERIVNRNVTVFAKLVPLNILFLSVSARRCRED